MIEHVIEYRTGSPRHRGENGTENQRRTNKNQSEMSKIIIKSIEIEIPDEIAFTEEEAREWIEFVMLGWSMEIKNPLSKYELCEFDITYTNLEIQQ